MLRFGLISKHHIDQSNRPLIDKLNYNIGQRFRLGPTTIEQFCKKESNPFCAQLVEALNVTQYSYLDLNSTEQFAFQLLCTSISPHPLTIIQDFNLSENPLLKTIFNFIQFELRMNEKTFLFVGEITQSFIPLMNKRIIKSPLGPFEILSFHTHNTTLPKMAPSVSLTIRQKSNKAA